MNFEIPLPLKQEHEALHDQLRQVTQADGEVGELAKALAQLMHPHFVKEDQNALPPLGLLAALAHGDVTPEMAGVLALTDQLEAGLPAMLAEHQTIVEVLQRLRDAAQRAGRRAQGAGRIEIVDFAQQSMQHARTEEEVMYPAAILVGKFVRQRLGQPTPAAR